MINVTKTYLPPLEEYEQYLQGIWERNQLTNNGPLVKELETKLKDYLGVQNLFLISNGTIALQIAIKALDLQGEIITTPFSYVATTSSIVWEGCQPVFVDIDPNTLCIDPDLIEKAITDKTTAILTTHVYGFPCDVERIQKIAGEQGLKIIYDAAHTFGVEYNGTSLLNFGDISTLSFHATKLFHTVEGGAIITNNDEIAHKIEYMRNFGHKGNEDYFGLGVNGKNSEMHAAMGLCVLPHVPELIHLRKIICDRYRELLKDTTVIIPAADMETKYNYAYFPVLFETEGKLMNVVARLKEKEIYPRRYFYPSLNLLPYIDYESTPIAEDISCRVLCLPLYPELSIEVVETISEIINSSLA